MASARTGQYPSSPAACVPKERATQWDSTRRRSVFGSSVQRDGRPLSIGQPITQICTSLLGTALSPSICSCYPLAERIGLDRGFLVAGAATVILLSANAGWIFRSRTQGMPLPIFRFLYRLIYMFSAATRGQCFAGRCNRQPRGPWQPGYTLLALSTGIARYPVRRVRGWSESRGSQQHGVEHEFRRHPWFLCEVALQCKIHSPEGLHVAIIMDGNGRWATRRGLPRVAGHRVHRRARMIWASVA